MHGEDNVDYKAVIEALKELALEGNNDSCEHSVFLRDTALFELLLFY